MKKEAHPYGGYIDVYERKEEAVDRIINGQYGYASVNVYMVRITRTGEFFMSPRGAMKTTWSTANHARGAFTASLRFKQQLYKVHENGKIVDCKELSKYLFDNDYVKIVEVKISSKVKYNAEAKEMG